MLGRLRKLVVERVPRGSPLWRVLQAGFLPLSVLIGTGYRLFSRRFSEPAIVIGGAGRSGTTLLLSILAAHPHLFAIDHETYAFCPREFQDDPDSTRNFQLHRLYTPLALARIPDSSTRWVEKTPQNVHYFRAILDHFGDDVRIIHVVRDGRDVITSRHPNKPGEFYYPVAKWVRAVRNGLSVEDDPRVLRIRYEDLVDDFDTTVREVCDFIDEPCRTEVLDWHEHTTVRKHTAWTGNVKPLHSKSLRRWESAEYGDRVAELMADPDAVALLGELGYLEE